MKMAWIILLAITPALCDCIPLTGEQIHASDLAPVLVAFAAADPATILGLAPAPGVHRIFSLHDLMWAARRAGIAGKDLPAAGVCLERAVHQMTEEELMGVTVQPTAIQVKNTAAVIITATLPPFGQPGARLDVTVAAVGDASNLQGGLLVMTPLKGPDNQVYAVAQGSVVTGGFVAGGRGSTKTVNHPTAGRIPNGAIIERVAPSVEPCERLRLQLRSPDYATASRITQAIDDHFGENHGGVAHADNSALITVEVPEKFRSHTVDFIAALQELSVEADHAARVVVNERTGTIVMGRDVTISPVTILHGPLTVEVQTTETVSQPLPLSNGQTVVSPQTRVAANQDPVKNVSLKPGATVDELVRALTATGSTPRDIIAVLQALKAAGAIEADLEII